MPEKAQFTTAQEVEVRQKASNLELPSHLLQVYKITDVLGIHGITPVALKSRGPYSSLVSSSPGA